MKLENNLYGLSEDELREMINFFVSIPELKKVILFWSRALSNHKKYSDLDLAIVWDWNEDLINKISSYLEEETLIPYFFDVVDYNSITNVNLKKHIDEHWRLIYSR